MKCRKHPTKMVISYCTNYSCFARLYHQSLSHGKPRSETEEEGSVLEYDSPSSSEDSEEESFANNNDETDDDVSGQIPSLDDEASFALERFTGLFDSILFDSILFNDRYQEPTIFTLTAARGSCSGV